MAVDPGRGSRQRRAIEGEGHREHMGTKDLDGRAHQRLLQKLPLKPTECRRLDHGSMWPKNVAEARVEGDEDDS